MRGAQIYHSLQQADAAGRQEAQRLSTEAFNRWAVEQDALASKAIPEAADPRFQAMVPEVLKEYGFQEPELAAGFAGAAFTLRDARVQRLIADGIKYRQATKGVARPVAKPVPPMVRPGASQPYAPVERQDLRGMESRLTRSGNLKDAAALLVAKRRST
jgi:hypothetical protein